MWLWPSRKLREKEAERLRSVPGVEVWEEGWICVPPDAPFVVVPMLTEMGIRFRGRPGPPRVPLTPEQLRTLIGQMSELRPIIDGREAWKFLYPFQKQTLAKLLTPAVDGGLLISPVGSGKTIMSLIWALAADLPLPPAAPEARYYSTQALLDDLARIAPLRPGILLITKGSVRYQLADETRRFTTLDPYVCRPKPQTKRDTALREPLAVYLQRQAALNQRPMIIAPWEALADHYEAIMDSGALSGLNGAPRWSIVLDEVTLGRASARGKYDVVEDDATGEEDLVFTPNVARATLAFFLRKECDRALAMTGTPVANRLKDVWGIADIAVPGVFGPTVKRFGTRYMGAIQGDFGPVYPKGPAGRTNIAELQRRLGVFTVRVPASIVQKQLPPKIRRMTSIPVDQQELRGWGLRELERDILNLAKKSIREAALRDGDVDYDTLDEHGRKAMDQISELRTQEAAARKAPAALEKIVEFLQMGAGKRKVVVFVGRQRLCDQLGAALTKKAKGIGAQVWCVHGATKKPGRKKKKKGDLDPAQIQEDAQVQADANDSLREEIRKAYMAHPGPCALVTTYQSMGMGANLQDTDYIAVVQLPLTPEEVEQLEGRGARLGQLRTLLIEYFKAQKTVDETIFALVLDKLPAVEAIAGESTTLNGLLDVLNRTEGRADRMRSLAKSFGNWFKNIQEEPEVAAPEETPWPP